MNHPFWDISSENEAHFLPLFLVLFFSRNNSAFNPPRERGASGFLVFDRIYADGMTTEICLVFIQKKMPINKIFNNGEYSLMYLAIFHQMVPNFRMFD